MSSITTETSMEPEEIGKEWLDIVLPATGIGFVFLLCVIFFNYVLKACKSANNNCCPCCGRNPQNESSARGHDNPERVNDDLPPSYSVAGLRNSPVEIFRVIADDTSENSYWYQAESEISEKLPSYIEFMEEKQHNARISVARNTDQVNSETQHSTSDTNGNPENTRTVVNSVTLPHTTVEIDNPQDNEENDQDAPQNEREPQKEQERNESESQVSQITTEQNNGQDVDLAENEPPPYQPGVV